MVGGTVSIFYRDTDGTIATRQRPVVEPPNLRRAHLAPRPHAIIFANGGEFKGKVKAEDFLLPSGDTMVSILNQDGKIKGDYIDAKGINIKDPSTGETILSMDSTGIHWAAKYSPIQVRYSTDKTAAVPGGWAETWNGGWSGEVWAIYSYDGGTTWTSPQRVQGANGRNGSDANVSYDNMLKALQKAADTKTSFITADEVGAPTIYGAKIYGAEIYAGGVGEKGGQVIGLTDGGIDIWNGHGNRVLTIHENKGQALLTTGYNYLDASALGITLEGSNFIEFKTMCVDFSGAAEVKGLHATFA